MAAQPSVVDIFRAYIGQFSAKIGEVEGSYEQILDLCEIAMGGQALIDGCADLLDLAKVKEDLAQRQQERIAAEPMQDEEAATFLKENGYHILADAIRGRVVITESRDARELVCFLRRFGHVADKPLGARFVVFCERVVEEIVTILIELIVEWMDDDDVDSANRLARDLGMIGVLAIQRMIDNDRLPEKVLTWVGPDELARIKTASKPAIALRCALIGVEYEEREDRVDQRDRGRDSDPSHDQRSERVSV